MSDSQAQAPPTPYGESDIRAQLRADSLTFPAAYEQYPWGQVVIKVNKKVFLFEPDEHPPIELLRGWVTESYRVSMSSFIGSIARQKTLRWLNIQMIRSSSSSAPFRPSAYSR